MSRWIALLCYYYKGISMTYIGNGIYTITEASKITGIKKEAIRRWISGYKYKLHNEMHIANPVFDKDYPEASEKVALSFLDLIEIKFIQSFRDLGVKWSVIREAARIAEKLVDKTHPFASRRFFTDTKTILLKIADESGETDLIDLVKKQYTLEKVIEPLLHECIDFDIDDMASRWWPLGRNGKILIDPKLNFGKPVLDSFNIPTETIYSAYLAEHSIATVAEWYEVDENSIRKAIEYEKNKAA
jgi:uncharacterized protein (DUF433 family)/DNA-binding transcriptional MerR regulator